MLLAHVVLGTAWAFVLSPIQFLFDSPQGNAAANTSFQQFFSVHRYTSAFPGTTRTRYSIIATFAASFSSRHEKNYLLVSVVVCVVFSVAGAASSWRGDLRLLSSVVVVSPVVLPSLLCVVVVTVLLSVVPFSPSQPTMNRPSVAIKTNPRKLFISIPFLIRGFFAFYQQKPFLPEALPPWLQISLVARNKKSRRGGTPKGVRPRRLTLQQTPRQTGVLFI